MDGRVLKTNQRAQQILIDQNPQFASYPLSKTPPYHTLPKATTTPSKFTPLVPPPSPRIRAATCEPKQKIDDQCPNKLFYAVPNENQNTVNAVDRRGEI